MKRIVVFGMGGIGGYIGARLGIGIDKMVAAGAFLGKPDLVFVARGAHLEAIKAKGLRYKSPEGAESVVHPTLATDKVTDVGPADLIFLCVKGYDLEGACKTILPLMTAKTIVVPLLNGADIWDQTRKIVKTGFVLPSGIYISSSITEPGLVVHGGGKGNLFLGREPGKIDFDPKPLQLLLEHSGIPFEWFEDPFPAIWNKYLFIASFALTTARSGLGIGGVVADEKWAAQAKEVQHEIAAIAKAKGIFLPTDAAAQAFEKGRMFGPQIKTSYQRDVEVPGKPNEGELFGGAITRMGAQLGVPTPTTERLYAEIRAHSGK